MVCGENITKNGTNHVTPNEMRWRHLRWSCSKCIKQIKPLGDIRQTQTEKLSTVGGWYSSKVSVLRKTVRLRNRPQITKAGDGAWDAIRDPESDNGWGKIALEDIGMTGDIRPWSID